MCHERGLFTDQFWSGQDSQQRDKTAGKRADAIRRLRRLHLIDLARRAAECAGERVQDNRSQPLSAATLTADGLAK